MTVVVKYPDSTKTSLEQRLSARARARWPDLAEVLMRHRAGFSYVDGVLPDGSTLKLCRLGYVGSTHQWRFAIYRSSYDDYDETPSRPAYPSAPARTPSTPPAASTSRLDQLRLDQPGSHRRDPTSGCVDPAGR